VAVAGATGYAGVEVVRLLSAHPGVELTTLTSEQYHGRPMAEVFPFLRGRIGQTLERLDPAAIADKARTVVTALPHGKSATFVAELLDRGCRVLDLSAELQNVGTQGARLGALAEGTLAECADATLTRLAPSPNLQAFNNYNGNDVTDCGGPCRQFDGDQAGCAGAYTVTQAGATSCFFHRGLCLPCVGCGQKQGACTNACSTLEYPPTTCGDATRTKFAGGPGTESCYRIRSQTLCESAWHIGRNARPANCYWTGNSCAGCGIRNEFTQNDCTNTCTSVPALTCKNAALTVTQRCSDFNGDQTGCEGAWHGANHDGTAASCFWDATQSRCRGCALRHEFPGSCTNTCL